MNAFFSGGGRMLILAALALMAPFEPSLRPDAQASEAELKAAWLYNFVQHVEWPATAFKDDHAPIVVGILGSHPIEEALGKVLLRKTVQGRPVEVRRVGQPADLKGVHAAFLPESEKERLEPSLAAVRGTPVLLITESEGLARRGAALNFFMDESKVRFEANVDAAARAGLSISSKLLKFARLVKD